KLQNDISSQQIGRLMKNLYVDRRRVEVATSAALTSLKSWGEIDSGEMKKSYKIANKYPVKSVHLRQWLEKDVIRCTENTALSLNKLNANPAFKQCDYKTSTNDLKTNHVEVNRQGLHKSMVEITKA